MIKNEMQVELIKIELNDAEENDSFVNPGGSVFIGVNGKTVEVIIHPCGELDFDGDTVEEEEGEAVMDFFYSNKEVNDLFPGDDFE